MVSAAVAMNAATPGICRHCGCGVSRLCRLEDGEACCWIDPSRTVCSAPACIMAEGKRTRAQKLAIERARPRRKRSWEVHELMVEERRQRGKRARERRKGRAT